MESARFAAADFAAPQALDVASGSINTLALANPVQEKSTYQEWKDWLWEKMFGKSCSSNPLYEEALKIASENLYDQSKAAGFKSQSGKYNCEIKTHQDAVDYANKVLQTAGDPYTHVLNRTQAEEVKKEIRGERSISGIGIQLVPEPADTKPGATHPVTVGLVFPGGPAEKAGLKPGDRILSVNGKSTNGLSQEEVVKLIKGDDNTQVAIKVDREGKLVDLYPTRGKLTLPALVSQMVDNDVLYLKMFDFMNDKSDAQMAKALRDNPNAKGYIIDLRGNGGGRLDELFQTLALFMKSGKVFDQEERVSTRFFGSQLQTLSISLTDNAVQARTSSGLTENIRRNPNLAGDKPIVVLVDKYSASASELFAGAIKDNGRAKLVGETTYGKGVGQQVFEIADGAMLTVTNVRYKTPNGNWAGDGAKNRIGIKPDIEVKQGLGYVPLSSNDAQFQKAMETLKGMRVNYIGLEVPKGLAMSY